MHVWSVQCFLWNIAQSLKQPPLFISFFTLAIPSILLHISLYSCSYTTRLSQSDGNFLVIPKFQSSVHKSAKQFGYSFAFDAPTVWNALPEAVPPPWPVSEKASKPTCTPRHILLSLTHPLVFSVVLGLLSDPGH